MKITKNRMKNPMFCEVAYCRERIAHIITSRNLERPWIARLCEFHATTYEKEVEKQKQANPRSADETSDET